MYIAGTHDENTVKQLEGVAGRAAQVALMADGHKGYWMPIGGVAAFRDWVSNAILAKEPALGLLCTFTDATVHVDPAHTGYNEVASMMFSNLALGFLSAGPKTS